ncbi:aspartate/glutamate racemase family protein [Rhizobium sp. NPDC090279]|uniref:aspartate/glutamate racemase family protein n=1 Tax=Rhizobium sp. NPDC090279 TaxID=3364499 RepID=UPI00383BD716
MSAPSRALGIIMLDTVFERPAGDVGHAASWRFPVKYRHVRGASVSLVVRAGGEGLVEDFIAAGHELVADGCSAIITSCGFMARHQRKLAEALGVPVAASSLMQLPMVEMALGAGLRPGVITYDEASLSPEVFEASGADPSAPVRGVPAGGAFHALIEGSAAYDHAALEAEVIDAARHLVAAHPYVGAIVLECTNMPPFAQAISAAVSRPVFDILTLGEWLFTSTSPRTFPRVQQGAV